MVHWLMRAACLAVVVPIATHFIRPSFDVHSSGVIVVSGASSGIGQSAALKLAGLGFTVLAGVRRESDGAALEAAFLGGKFGGSIHPVLLDVTDGASVAAAATAASSLAASKGLVGVVGVVCNAGVISAALPVELADPDDDARLFAVNYFGAKRLAVAMLPQLRASKGRLVVVTSIAGHIAAPFGQPYSASKFAARSLADSLRGELAPCGVSVSHVDPGFVTTPILGPLKGGQADGWFGSAKFNALPASGAKAGSTAGTNGAIVDALTAARPRAAYFPGTAAGLPARVAAALFALLGAVDPAWTDLAAAAA
jgi:NAD(P)-dependent dehydrogenase (short-subunit alcohol dehydrogenase family)